MLAAQGAGDSPPTLPTDPKDREWAAFRARAAFVHVTGAFPSHLRRHFTALLRAVSRMRRTRADKDSYEGAMEITPAIVQEYRLEEHPMVVAVREKESEGFEIRPLRSPQERRPYTKVLMHRRGADGKLEKITVHADGNITSGWH